MFTNFLIIGLSLALFLAGCETARPAREIASVKGPRLDKSGYLYDPEDQSCGGYPRLQVETVDGTCLGMVLPKDRAFDVATKKAFIMPRTMAKIPGTSDFLVSDMGGWHPKKGSIYRLTKDSKGRYQATLLKTGLTLPHNVTVGPDGRFYIGEMKQISRFELQAGQITNWTTVVQNLMADSDDMHPLSMFTFDPRNNDMYINTGAPTDHCVVKEVGGEQFCPSSENDNFAVLSKVPWSKIVNPPAGGFRFWAPVARGLRNSMAMVIHPSGFLIQGENSRDFPSLDEPFEELNVVDLNADASGLETKLGFHYGWPYCYNFRATSPEWGKNKPFPCEVSDPKSLGDYQEPYVLIPPHAAPLYAGYYKGAMFNQSLNGKLLMAWHGYQPTGHRLVAYNVDANGRPVLGTDLSKATYNFDQGDACPVAKKMAPKGGLMRYAPYVELITRWNEKKGFRPRGAPVSFLIDDDGSIFITDDKNQTIVRLALETKSVAKGAKNSKEKCDISSDSDRVELLAWRRAVNENAALLSTYTSLKTNLVMKYCAACHAGAVDESVAKDDLSTLDFLTKAQWFTPGNEVASKALQSIENSGTTPPMPPTGSPQFFGTPEGAEISKLVRAWIGAIPTDVATRFAKTTLKSSRNIRSQPGTKSSVVCGALATGATAYVDPRSSTFVKADGWMWTRVYLTKDHKSLLGTKCVWPKDGVFYLATMKAI